MSKKYNSYKPKRLRFIPFLGIFVITFLLQLTSITIVKAHAIVASRLVQVEGTVTSPEGEKLPGVVIKVVNSTKATVTDIEGKYSLSVEEKDVLVFSFVGHVSQTIPVNGRTQINVSLVADVQTLDAVLVVGYGTVKKSDLTGSVASIKLNENNEQRVVSVPEALQGKIAGVQILNNTGEPGAGMTFRVRGATSVMGSNRPLIVIDGQPIESDLNASSAGSGLPPATVITPTDPLATINPSDIKSIEILKDASATAIYGSRGANGVVMITTKSGSRTKEKITYGVRFDLSQMPKKIQMANSREYMNFINEGDRSAGKKDTAYTSREIDSLSNLYNTDWHDLIYRQALSQDHQFSLSGGDQKSDYLLSANFTQQNSVIKNADYTRGGVRFNFNRDIGKKLVLGLRSSYSIADRNYGQQANTVGNVGSSVVLGALVFNPIRVPYTDNGELDVSESVGSNPVLVTTLVKDNTKIQNAIFNLSFDYKILKSLTYRLSGGYNKISSLRQQYWPKGTPVGDNNSGSALRATNDNSNYTIDHLLTYTKNTKDHSINAVVGYSYQRWNTRAFSINPSGFPSDVLEYNNLEAAQVSGISRTSNNSRSLSSILGRFNYSFQSKYLLTLTGRADGSSRLAKGKQWGIFPSVGIGWNITNEKFMQNFSKTLSSMKLRASYGISGNESIGIGATKAFYGTNSVVFNQIIYTGYNLANFDNPNLTWETTAQYNLGTDVSLLDNRITLTVDWYNKVTTDLLLNLTLPPSATYTSYATNMGKVTNKGLDIDLKSVILTGALKWDVNANFSTTTNKLVDLGNTDIIYGGNVLTDGSVSLAQAITVAKVGYPISSFWGYKTDGVYQTIEEVAAGPEAGIAKPGDVRFVDVSGDGKITEEDKTIIGKPNPDFTYGFGFDFAYKKITLSLGFLGSYGNQLINLTQWYIGSLNTNGNFNLSKDAYDNRWTGPNTGNNKYPRVTTGNRFNGRFPDYMVEDASFFRLQNVNLGYTFDLPAVLRVKSIRAYVSATNLFTITNYTGYDPNVNAFGAQPLRSGIDSGTLPQAKTYSAGIVASF